MTSWPLAFPQLATFLLHYERFPSGGLSVRRHTLVEATDGPVGHLLAFVPREPDHRVTNVILQRGYWWWRSEVIVPATAIAARYTSCRGVYGPGSGSTAARSAD